MPHFWAYPLIPGGSAGGDAHKAIPGCFHPSDWRMHSCTLLGPTGSQRVSIPTPTPEEPACKARALLDQPWGTTITRPALIEPRTGPQSTDRCGPAAWQLHPHPMAGGVDRSTQYIFMQWQGLQKRSTSTIRCLPRSHYM